MNTYSSGRSEWKPFGPVAAWRGAAVVIAMALLLAGCGHGPGGNTSSAPPPSAKPTTSAAPASVPVPSAPASLPTSTPAVATSAAQAQQSASAAKAKLESMSVQDLLAAAREAYAQHRLVAPAGDNAMEYYEAVLAKDPDNQVAKDALRETFPFGVPDVEKTISQNNFDEAGREINLLATADSTNYTLTLLRSKLDAQKKLQARQQEALQHKQLQEQKAAELAVAQQAAAAKAAAEKEAAAKLVAQQQAAVKTAPVAKPAAAPPPKPVGETRNAVVTAAAQPDYPLQAARNQTSGYAVVEFTVAADGSVEDPHVTDSSPRRVFDSAAIQAVKRSKFKPALKDGTPVASTLRRRIDFKFGG